VRIHSFILTRGGFLGTHAPSISSSARSSEDFMWSRSPLLIVGFIVGLAAACDGGPKAGDEALYYGPKLLEGDAKSRDAAMKHLSELKDKRSLPFLYDALKGNEAEIRPEAAQLIGLLGDASSVDPLVAGIDWTAGAGRDNKSRANATTNERIAKALGRVAPAGDAKAIEALKRLSAANNNDVQLASIVALGDLKATAAVKDLVDIAEGHTNNFMVKNAVEALGKIGDEKAIPVLVRMLFFERQGVSFYREASYALFQIGKPAVEPLMALYTKGTAPSIEDLHVERAFQKAKSLVVLADIADPASFPLILDAVNTGDEPNAALIRLAGADAAGRLGLDKAIPGLVKRMDDVDISQSEHALAALTLLGHKAIVKDLGVLASHDGYAKQCKARGNSDEQCTFSEAQVRKQRITALARMGGPDEAAVLEKLAAAETNADLKKVFDEQKARISAIQECGAKGLPCWAGKLKDPDARVRERAVLEHVWQGDATALVDALGDADNDVRYFAAVAVLRKLPADKAVADRVKKILEEEQGKTQYIRVNEDLKRVEVRVRRGA
jgi:HEAT repeat protein